MSWRQDEIWLDTDLPWSFRERAGGQGASLALRAPTLFGLAPALPGPVEIPNGLAESRRRRAELRRRRFERRTRAAALVIAPATLLPLAVQRLGSGSSGEAALANDPPTLELAGAPAAGPPARVSAEAAKPIQPQFPKVRWNSATSHGLPYSGWLTGGTRLPVEGVDWVTWNPVKDVVPNKPYRLYGNEHTIRTILAVLADHRDANPGAPRVVIGDISLRNGGPMEAHVSHQNGLDVDVYYPRLDRKLHAPLKTSQVDRRLAQDLVDRFVAAGAQKVFVGYSTRMRGPRDIVVPYPNHEDHMHVRFSRPTS